MATPVRNRPIMHCNPLSIEYFVYVYRLCLLFDFATKKLQLATIVYHLVDKWRLKDFVNFEPCTYQTESQMSATYMYFHSKKEIFKLSRAVYEFTCIICIIIIFVLICPSGSPQLLSECEEWFQRFPHLR